MGVSFRNHPAPLWIAGSLNSGLIFYVCPLIQELHSSELLILNSFKGMKIETVSSTTSHISNERH